MKKLRIGVVGCGMISKVYIQNIKQMFAQELELVACADLDPARAETCANENGIRAETVEQLMADKEVDCVLNLTVPASHYEINKQALLHGKHAYSEKPLAIEVKNGQELVKLAADKHLFIGAAPDTFLGAGLQTAIKLVKDQEIGKIVGVETNLLSRGPESFHPNPAFFYQKGAGPLLDMGPYYLTALVALLGPISEVVGFADCPTKQRLAKKTGQVFPSEVDTHIAGLLRFANGVIGQLTVSWELPFVYWESHTPYIHLLGTNGQILVPDPNKFEGPVLVRKSNESDFSMVPLLDGYAVNSRGLGLAQVAKSLEGGEKPLVNGQLSLHVLEAMLGILESNATGKIIKIKDSCEQPELLNEKL